MENKCAKLGSSLSGKRDTQYRSAVIHNLYREIWGLRHYRIIWRFYSSLGLYSMPRPDPCNREGRWPQAKGISCAPDKQKHQMGWPRPWLTPWLYYKEVFPVPHAFFGKYCNSFPTLTPGKREGGASTISGFPNPDSLAQKRQ